MSQASSLPITTMKRQAGKPFPYACKRRVSARCYGRFLVASSKEYLWSTGTMRAGSYRFQRLRRCLDSPAEDWSFRILETKDKLLDALDFLRVTYNEMLAGKAVRAADEILANVETILRNDEEIPDYTVVAAIRIHRPLSPDAKRKVLLLFPTA